MKINLARLDIYYKADFSRPEFGQVMLFSNIAESLYDAFSDQVPNLRELIQIQGGNSIATTGAVLNFLSDHGSTTFEARLDQFEVRSHNHLKSESIEIAIQNVQKFESVVQKSFTEVHSVSRTLILSMWLTVNDIDADKKSEQFIRDLTWQADSPDPFELGCSSTTSAVKFNCLFEREGMNISLMLDKSAFPGSHLFAEVAGVFRFDSKLNSFEKEFDYLQTASKSVAEKLGLTLEDG